MDNKADNYNYTGLEIAIVGISARCPESEDIDQFWKNLKDGKECITFLEDKELLDAGVSRETINDPNYVKACAYLKDADKFDAGFFGYNPREAEIMDPQQRLFLETCWKAFEDAGYTKDYEGLVGVYGSSSMNTYVLSNVSSVSKQSSFDPFQAEIGNDKDYVTTRVSYKMNLKGPSFAVQSACSSSLVAVHVACRALLSGECDMALAGGVCVKLPMKEGYFYRNGGIQSPDGHCRAFDQDAMGTIFGSGVGVVVLKPLSEAIKERDTIYAVIKGSAINNDGEEKVGYTASSVIRQSEVIKNAYIMAEVDPSSIQYIETHGTGTNLGDPVEIKGLMKAFEGVDKQYRCAIGSVKTNVGHLIAAAGIIGLIKTALCLKNKMLVPSLNYHKPNQNIDFKNTPFYVNTETRDWISDYKRRRAGVSSYGIGGTNAHIVLEEAPQTAIQKEEKQNLFVVSAKSKDALKKMIHNLELYVDQKTDADLPGMAYTLQIGRESFYYKASFVGSRREEVLESLRSMAEWEAYSESDKEHFTGVVFLFPGQGSQYIQMGAELYNTEAHFRKTVDECITIFNPLLKENLYEILFSDKNDIQNRDKIQQTYISQALLFTIEYALGKLWIDWGIKPEVMIGHSLGEYVAACLAGVFTLKDALELIAIRGKLLQSLPEGTMIALEADAAEIETYVGNGVSIAAENSQYHYVLSGNVEVMKQVRERLEQNGKKYSLLKTSRGFHSEMVESVMEEFKKALDRIERNTPAIPYISNVTGTYIKAGEAVSSEYWLKHLRNTVRFSDGIQEILSGSAAYIFLEAGPGRTLGNLVKRHISQKSEHVILHSLPNAKDPVKSDAQIVRTLGVLWERGASVDWKEYNRDKRYTRIPLPTYPFARTRYWIDRAGGIEYKTANNHRENQVYVQEWKEKSVHKIADLVELEKTHLVFVNDQKYSIDIGEAISETFSSVIMVQSGNYFKKVDDYKYRINQESQQDYEALLSEIAKDGFEVERIIHLLSIRQEEMDIENYSNYTDSTFYSLLYLAQAFMKQGKKSKKIICDVVVHNMEQIGEEIVSPGQALIKGPCKVISSEMPNIICHGIDIQKGAFPADIAAILMDKQNNEKSGFVVYRNNKKYEQVFTKVSLESGKANNIRFKNNGVYMITGGLGGLGLIFARHIAEKVKHPKLILTGRSGFPCKADWQKWLENHDDAISKKIKTLRVMEDKGADIMIIKVDVTDELQMKVEIDAVYNKYGGIDGVIHAAGIAGGGMIAMQSKEKTEEVMLPKVKGALVLEAVLRNERLDFFVLCSSTIAVLGGIGQVDYCSANSYLDSFAHYYRKKYKVQAVSINWDEWTDTGMAREGADVSDQKVILSHPIFNYYERKSANEITFSADLSTASNWLLNEHRILGKPAFPGTAYIEAVYKAFQEINGHTDRVEINDLLFRKALIPDTDQVRLSMDFEIEGSNEAEFCASGTTVNQTYEKLVSGRVHKYDGVSSKHHDPADIIASLNMKEMTKVATDENGHNGIVFWGNRWKNNLKKVYTSGNSALAYLELPQKFHKDMDEFEIHPALFDVATGYAVQNFSEKEDFLPFMYKKIVIYRPLETSFYSYIKFKNFSDLKKDMLRFDVILFNEKGEEMVVIEDFSLVKVKNNE